MQRSDEEQQAAEMAEAWRTQSAEPEPCPNYPYIRAWGKWMGHDPEYTEIEVSLAVDFGAPDTAIYWMPDKAKYAVWEDLTNPVVKQAIKALAAEFPTLV